jgi:hypothetical protein
MKKGMENSVKKEPGGVGGGKGRCSMEWTEEERMKHDRFTILMRIGWKISWKEWGEGKGEKERVDE